MPFGFLGRAKITANLAGTFFKAVQTQKKLRIDCYKEMAEQNRNFFPFSSTPISFFR
jgi:hypothetical protein